LIHREESDSVLRTLGVGLGIDVSASTTAFEHDIVAYDTVWSKIDLVEACADLIRQALEVECFGRTDQKSRLSCQLAFVDGYLSRQCISIIRNNHTEKRRD
jgi:hypothetical protein